MKIVVWKNNLGVKFCTKVQTQYSIPQEQGTDQFMVQFLLILYNRISLSPVLSSKFRPDIYKLFGNFEN